MCAGADLRSRFRRVPACAGVSSGGRFRRVPACAGVGPEAGSGRFRKVPEGSDVWWCRFRRQPEGSGGFQKAPVFRKVQESSSVVCCLATLTGAAMLFLNPFW